MAPAQFSIDADEGFYLTVADDITVYEEYDAAVAEIQSKLTTDAEGFLAEVAIEQTGESDDVAVTLEQVGWQQIIRDMDQAAGTDQ
ncbi:hypothetical protein [Halovenus sp. HT40]|uniref:hypothetical protein n=1 Tax=Halovenus sp. HT40 TaxID=3126691 RepID=UPI00300EDC82